MQNQILLADTPTGILNRQPVIQVADLLQIFSSKRTQFSWGQLTIELCLNKMQLLEELVDGCLQTR